MHELHERLKRQYHHARVTHLARTFTVEMHDALGLAVDEVVRRNKAETDPNVCHSHDFCDANMVMLPAFQRSVGREPDTASDEDTSLWNDAWDVAKQAGFDLASIEYTLGTRFRARGPLDRYPHAAIAEGERGSLTSIATRELWVTLDLHHTGLDDWANQLGYDEQAAPGIDGYPRFEDEMAPVEEPTS